MHKLIEFVVTFCYIGKIKIAPGSFASLFTFPLFYVLRGFAQKCKLIGVIESCNIYKLLFSEIYFATIFLFILGVFFTHLYIKNRKKSLDPQEVVIDEVTGQILVIKLTSFSVVSLYQSSLLSKISVNCIDFLFLFFIPFVLFRIFDILKPWPIKWLNSNVKNAFGVMIDDIVAALFAVMCQYFILFLVLTFFP